jgi:ATP-dependent Clp protease ATP-binding subunit ClpC
MFERFTDRARRVVVLAQEEARMLNHNYIGTEHILLGLIHEGHGVAAKALEALGISLTAVREQVVTTTGRGKAAPSGHIPFTPEAKNVLQLSLREALDLGHNYIGTEHILLGLIREGQGVAARVLVGLGADLDRVRQQVTDLLRDRQPEDEGRLGRAAGEAASARGARLNIADLGARLGSLEDRLAALEQRVGTGPDLSDLDEVISRVRRDKATAIDTQDFEQAAALRETERGLLDDKAARLAEWRSQTAGLPSLSAEVAHLRELLRQHGIDPEDGVA